MKCRSHLTSYSISRSRQSEHTLVDCLFWHLHNLRTWSWLVISFTQFSCCLFHNFYTALKASSAIFASLIRGNLAYIIAKGGACFLRLPFHFKIIFCLLFLWFLGGRRVLVFHVQHVYPCQPSYPDLPPATLFSFPFLSSVFLFTSFSPSAYKHVQIPFSQKVNFPSILSSL